LLELNRQRAEQERLIGAAAEKSGSVRSKTRIKKGRAAKADQPDAATLFDA
jgi:hypothetical protein